MRKYSLEPIEDHWPEQPNIPPGEPTQRTPYYVIIEGSNLSQEFKYNEITLDK